MKSRSEHVTTRALDVIRTRDTLFVHDGSRPSFSLMHTNKDLRRPARQFRALGNERRLYILSLLKNRAWNVRELSMALKIHDASVTKHLQKLFHAGLVEGRRRGKKVYFFLTNRVRSRRSFLEDIHSGLVS